MMLSDKPAVQPGAADAAQAAATAAAYREGMRRLAAGVCLITSSRGTSEAGIEYAGMIATAVTSVSSDPPTLLICVNRNASLFEMIDATGSFCVNVLGTQAVPLVALFSSSTRRAERFQSGEWDYAPSGSPVCTQALVAFDCRVAKVVDWHTHAIFIGEVNAVVHPQSAAVPLLYMDQGFHHLVNLPVAEPQ